MESKQTVSVVKRSVGKQVLFIAATLMAVIGRVYAGPMNVTPAGEGAVRAWNVPYNPVSPGMVTGLQGFLRTDYGANLLAQVPSLSILERLSPESEAHRRIIGALGLSSGFEAQLQSAIEASDSKALSGALSTIIGAYRNQDAEGKINETVETRADEILDAVGAGNMSIAELSAAASELGPFAFVSAKAKAIGGMASSARSANTMDVAQRIASTLIQRKASVTLDQAVEGGESVVADMGKKNLPKDWQLHAASTEKNPRMSGARDESGNSPVATRNGNPVSPDGIVGQTAKESAGRASNRTIVDRLVPAVAWLGALTLGIRVAANQVGANLGGKIVIGALATFAIGLMSLMLLEGVVNGTRGVANWISKGGIRSTVRTIQTELRNPATRKTILLMGAGTIGLGAAVLGFAQAMIAFPLLAKIFTGLLVAVTAYLMVLMLIVEPLMNAGRWAFRQIRK